MVIFIRIDVDKPYGHRNLFDKIISKINENYFTVSFPKRYLKGLTNLLEYLNSQNISSNIYFRNCTVPNKRVLQLLNEGNHSIGFHAEDTRNKESFAEEIKAFEKNIGLKIHHFTKHGSGELKLGKNHYPSYEPDKYLEWSKEMKLIYKFGNGTLDKKSVQNQDFISDMFWAESWYRKKEFNSIDTLIEQSKNADSVFLIHPANYETHSSVKKDLKYCIQEIKNNNLEVKVI